MNMMYIIMVKAPKNRSILLLLSLLVLPLFSLGQEGKKKIVAQFDYNQIDSLVNTTIVNLAADSGSFIVSNTMWYIGSYNEGNSKFATHRNHFDIYILFSKKGKMYVQKIDNYSFFKKRKVNNTEVADFLMHSFSAMKNETLNRKVDTSYIQGKLSTSTTIIDHQLVRTVKIAKASDTLQYEYPSDYSANPKNLQTYRYKFLAYIDKVTNRYDKRKGKRENVVFGYDSEIR